MMIPIPYGQEIERIVQCYEKVERSVAAHEEQHNKLGQQKLGLMHDLMTGRVRVKATESEVVRT